MDDCFSGLIVLDSLASCLVAVAVLVLGLSVGASLVFSALRATALSLVVLVYVVTILVYQFWALHIRHASKHMRPWKTDRLMRDLVAIFLEFS